MASPEIPAGLEHRVRLEVAHLAFGYGETPVLRDLCLEVGPGRIVGLLGPNGSGKSTLLRILSGVLTGYRGVARVGGREVRDHAPRELARKMAVVPQETTFGFPYTALEVVLMGRHPHLAGLAFETPADVAVARDALARCGALALADRPIQELSAGERQRVVFARALCQQPSLLLLDEPASFLDIRHQVELYDIVRELAAEGCGVLTVLHDINLAAEYCDEVHLLHGGRIEAGGRTDDVLTYANLKHVFGTEVYVDLNDLTGKLLVIPLSGRARRRLEEMGTMKTLHATALGLLVTAGTACLGQDDTRDLALRLETPAGALGHPTIVTLKTMPPGFDVVFMPEMPTAGCSFVVDSLEVDEAARRISARATLRRPAEVAAQVVTPTPLRLSLGSLARGRYVLEVWLRDDPEAAHHPAEVLLLEAS
jgi:iron complex transport system ATP-binding protein